MEITLEQALQNIQICADKFFVGTKIEHLAMETSINVIKEELVKKKNA